MKRPTWALIVGILGIVFGVFGLFGSAQTAMTPKMLLMQKQMMESFPFPASTPGQQADMEQFKKAMGSLWGEPPAWFGPACAVLGVVGLIVNGLYILGAALLLQVKPYSARLFTLILWLSIAYSVARAAIFLQALSLMGMAYLFTAGVGIVLDVILLVVIATGDKAAFTAESSGESA